MKVIFHGGAQEVGRSCVEFKIGKDRYIMDAGIKFEAGGVIYPQEVFEVPEIDGLFLSHAHLDHSGGLPLYEHYNMLCPIICSMQTKVITRIMLKDSFKIAKIKNTHPAYDNFDIKKVMNSIVVTPFDKLIKFRDIKYRLHNAGHIPGSAMIEVQAEGKKIIYTGDFNLTNTNLMIPASKDLKDVDVLIMESTYGYREIAPRDEMEFEFLKEVERAIQKGGRVLIPVFAVGRAQEILIMLSKKEWNVPIYFDGLAKKVTRRMVMNYSKFISNKEKLAYMFNEKVQSVSSENRRNRAANAPGIFVTTSGMLTGGPAVHYLKHMFHDEKSAVLLVGYQAKGTRGRMIMEDKKASIKGEITDIKCHIRQFEFSAHSDREDLHEFILAVKPKKLFLMHGDPDNIQELADWAQANTTCEVITPKNTESYEI